MAKTHSPPSFKPEYSELARKFCLLGATDDELAPLLEVALATLARWLAEIPEFAAAVKRGRDEADANVAERLYARAMGYSHEATKIMQSGGKPVTVTYTEHYPPDATCLLFWLKNRQRSRWRDKIEPEPADVSDMLAELDAASERARTVRRD